MTATSLPALSELLALCYKKERAAARRRMAVTGMAEDQALCEILQASDATQPLSALLQTRRTEQLRLQEKHALKKTQQAQRLAARRKAAYPSDTWLAWFDGSARPNPGRMGWGGILQAPDGRIFEVHAQGAYGDSSRAEYLALHAVLKAALAHRAQDLIVHGDSRVVIDDVLAIGRTAHALADCRQYALELIAQLHHVTLRWIPRHRNEQADRLAQQASRASHPAVTAAP